MLDYILQLFVEYHVWVAIYLILSLIEGVADCQSEVKLNRNLPGPKRFSIGPKFLIFWCEIISWIAPIPFFIYYGFTIHNFLVLFFFIGAVHLAGKSLGYIWMLQRHKSICESPGICIFCKNKSKPIEQLSEEPAQVSLFNYKKTVNSKE